MNRYIAKAIALLIIVLFVVWRSHDGTRLDSLTIDEPWHIVAGTAYVRQGDFQLNPEHPPLVKRWIGAVKPDACHLRPTPILAEKAQERRFVEETFFAEDDIILAQNQSRAAMWTFHAILLMATSHRSE